MSQVPPPPVPSPAAGAPAPGAPYGTPPTPERPRSWFARHKVLTGLGAVVALLVVVGIATSGGEEEPAAAPPAATEPADAPADDAAPAEPVAEEPAVAGIGTPVQDGKFEFTVTSVEPGVARVGDGLVGQDAQGQYVLVHLTVANVGDQAQYFSASSQSAVDAQDRQFSADLAAAAYLGDASSLISQINPGNTVTGTLVFDVPADTTLTTLTLHDSPLSGGVDVAIG